MSKVGKIKRNKYHIDEQNNTAIFELRNVHGNTISEFVADADDLDIFTGYTWARNIGTGCVNDSIRGSNGDSVMRAIADKYVYANNECELFFARLDKSELNYCKTNLVCVSENSRATLGQLSYVKPRQSKSVEFLHTYYSSAQGGVYAAIITTELKDVLVKNIRRSFSISAHSKAKERAIYAAYLFEKEFYGDNFPEDEYTRKEEAFKVLDKTERAEVEDAIVEQLEKLRLARKKIDNYYQSQTLAAKLASGEVVVRPDWKIGNVDESEDAVVKPEPEPEPELEPEPEPEPERVVDDCTIKCSRALLTSIQHNKDANSFVHITKTIVGKNRWTALGGIPNNRNIFNIAFAETKHDNAKAMAVYAAYLFEKLVYGDNFPKAEYNRKLEVIKTLSAKDIEFVNSKVAGKLEKVYTVLKELASEKSAKSDEPLSTYKIEKSTDELLKQIKQTPLKEDALETAATVDEPTEKYPDIFGNPEVQKAIAEIKQKPSLFQRIKNWFAN